MKKIFVVAAMVLAVTSISPGRTRPNDTSKQGVNAEKGAENLSQCNLTFITESLPDFPLGVPANFRIEVCCGTPPYQFEVTQGTLPAGLHLNQNGKITGKPTEEADTTVFVKVTDSAGCSLTQAFQVRVVPS